MKVRISYGVELEDVPHESARMLAECYDDLKAIQALLNDIIEDLSDVSIDRPIFDDVISKCRDLLVKTDSRLNDNQMIMAGFFDAKEAQIRQLQEEQKKAELEVLEKEQKKAELQKALGEL